MTDPQMTVVVPTRDRPAALARCLAALAHQHGVGFEVVVVDDGSNDAAAVAAVVAGAPRARVVRAAGRGPAAARNLGVIHATAAFVAFTDDDCAPGPDWLATLHARLTHGARVVAGPTRVGDRRDPYAAAAQTITNSLVDATFDPVTSTVGFAPTSNLAVATALHAAIPFDEDYPLAAGEDRDWCDRVTATGATIAWEPAAWVDHAPELGLRRYWRQQTRYGRGAHRYHRRGHPGSGTGPGPGLGPGGTGLRPRRLHVDLLRAGFAQGARVGSLVVLAQLATALGYLGEAAAQARSSRGSPGRSAQG